jgi:class 3 adenylate cyclase
VTLSDRSDLSLRVSDAERDHATEALREHVAAGRLSMDEFDERIEEVLASRTAGDLRHALRDLPEATPAPAGPETRSGRGRRVHYALWRFATINGMCVGIWAATGAHAFWPAYVLIPTGLITLRRVFTLGSVGHGYRHEHRHDQSTPRQRPAEDEPTRRTVMSVLYVDIVDSTRRAAAAGDAAWRRLAEQYERAAAFAVHNCSGVTLFNKGDEVVAGFDSPAAAVRCAERIRAQSGELGLQVRAGIHAGEVDRIGSRAEGIAMHIGRRVCESAAPDEILVSSTVRDLLAGSGTAFGEAGEYELKGLDGTWRLYEAAPR